MRLLVIFLFLSGFAKAADEEPPRRMQDYLKWARAAEATEERIRRLETFWNEYLPSEQGGSNSERPSYGDATHIFAVWGCAWDLVRAYVDTGEKEKSHQMLDWLQMYDSRSQLKMPPKTTEGER
ncbi:MAG: hypothetical protein ACI8UO_002497 [Verrucomicrobiales bacterium]|jgi:hypothetical protein